MKKFLLTLTLFASLLFFTGCPYSSDVAIDSPSVRINDKLLGTWELRSSSDQSYIVTKVDNFTYKFEKHSKSSSDVSTYFAYMSDVAGTKYLNLWEDDKGSGAAKTYYFYKFEQVSDGLVKFIPVTENIDEKFNTSAELKGFITKHQNLSFFFAKDEDTYIKTGN